MGTGYAGLVAVDAYRMRAAIYTVSKDGKEIARLPSLIWVRLAEPGLYLVCGEDVLVGGEIYHVRGCPILPGKETVTLDYIEE